jgi:putative transposase
MPRANRYLQAGCLYHLTHRCHDRKFLFRFGVARTEYRKRLRQAVKQSGISLLAYSITSNHTHLLAEAPSPGAISRMMQKLEGEFAEWYNGRKRRCGAFWSDRYHCTLVDGGEYAWNCMKYIDLNMVRAGVVRHPSEWRWCGYDELVGTRERYRVLESDCVLQWQGGTSREDFIENYRTAIQEAIQKRELERQPVWTERIAVGGEVFTKKICQGVRDRTRLAREEVSAGVWTVREALASYGALDRNPANQR